MQQLDRFFVAIVPSEDINKPITEIKQYISQQYNSKAALRSPPHITLVPPFLFKQMRTEELIATIKEAVVNLISFSVDLTGFGSFPPKVIVIQVQPSNTLSQTQRILSGTFKKKLNINHGNTNNRVFQPHITVAFRDLRKAQFYPAWEEFSRKEFKQSFTCQSISLLKHNGKIWEVYREFSFLS